MARILHIRQRNGVAVASGEPQMTVRHGSCGAEWNWTGHRLDASTDRFGTYPLYYYARNDEVCVSTSLMSMLQSGVPADFDDTGVATLLRVGSCLGDDTPFAHIRLLPPAGRLTWDAGGSWSVTGGVPRLEPSRLNRNEAIDAFLELFSAAVRRGLPKDDIVLPLSGGRDSRHILLQLLASGCRPERVATLRYFPPRRDEDGAATMLAERLGLQYEVLPQYESRVDSEIRKNELSGFSTDWHAWFLPFVDRLPGEARQNVYTGYGGDTLARGRPLDKKRVAFWQAGDLPGLADLQLAKRPYTEAALKMVLQPAAYERFGPELLRARLIEEFGAHVDQPNPELSYTFYNSLRRRTAPMWFPMCSDDANISAPFLDGDVYDLMASLPLSLDLGRQFHTEAIARAFPQYADIPYGVAKGSPPRTDVSYFRKFASELTDYAIARESSAIFNVRGLIERFSGCRRSGDGTLIEWLQPAKLFVVLQLEAAVAGHRAT